MTDTTTAPSAQGETGSGQVTTRAEPCADAAEHSDGSRIALVAFYADPDAAHRRLDLLSARDAPMDRISVLGRADTSGDDPLGIYYSGVGDRMRGWGGIGAFWGGIFGLLSGAAGVFVLPGLAPMVAAGPLVGSLTGAAAGAAAGGVLMAGAGASQQLAVAIHRMGIPESCIGDMQTRLAAGETMVMLVVAPNEAERWHPTLEERATSTGATAGADEGAPPPVVLWELPFTGFADAVQQQHS